MQIYRSEKEIKKDKNTVLTIGTFDGVHEGHKDLFNKLTEETRANSYRNLIITFEPHPRTILSNSNVGLLTTYNEKIELFELLGIENLLVLEFTKKFSEQSSDEFVKNIICENVGAKHIIIGHDHKFGKNRSGNEELLRKLGERNDFFVTSVPPVTIDNEIVSSTLIRNSLLKGDLKKANKLLGRYYSFEGKIVKGVSRGRILGFPTANIEVENKYKLIPHNGVYVVECELNSEKVFGLMNIGVRPTFEDSNKVIIEVHLLDFEKNIYGEKIKVNLLKRLRDEKKFESKEELIYQIERDKKETIQYIGALIN